MIPHVYENICNIYDTTCVSQDVPCPCHYSHTRSMQMRHLQYENIYFTCIRFQNRLTFGRLYPHETSLYHGFLTSGSPVSTERVSPQIILVTAQKSVPGQY